MECGADLHMAQLMPLPLTVSCFSKIQIGFTFLVPAHPGSPGQRAVKRVCVCIKTAEQIELGFDSVYQSAFYNVAYEIRVYPKIRELSFETLPQTINLKKMSTRPVDRRKCVI